jgi:DNA polymerase (family 10)
MEAVVDTAVATGTALEINGSPERLDLSDTHARLATERGARLAIGTDAHTGDHLYHMPLGVGVARRGWAQAKDVINTLPLRDLLGLLKGAIGGSRRRS